jgi:hypothetical protein
MGGMGSGLYHWPYTKLTTSSTLSIHAKILKKNSCFGPGYEGAIDCIRTGYSSPPIHFRTEEDRIILYGSTPPAVDQQFGKPHKNNSPQRICRQGAQADRIWASHAIVLCIKGSARKKYFPKWPHENKEIAQSIQRGKFEKAYRCLQAGDSKSLDIGMFLLFVNHFELKGGRWAAKVPETT